MLDNFMISLEIMWKGMLGIFIVIIIITLLVILIQKTELFFDKIKKDNSSNKE